jgi:ribosome biogenesis GTPase A
MKIPLEKLPVTSWYPGHMLSANRQMAERLKLVDLVVELLDARIPATSRNPAFDRLFGSKPRCLVFTKSELADPKASASWLQWFQENGNSDSAFFVDAQTGLGLKRLVPGWHRMVERRRRATGAKHALRRPLRIMIAGIPNVGKSTLVNRLSVTRRAAVGPRPGVTRNQQWIPLQGNVELLDTPGVLWPRIKDKRTELKLGLVGAIKDELVGAELLVEFLWEWARSNPGMLDLSDYDLTVLPATSEELLEAVGRRRGVLGPGGVVDTRQTADLILREFRDGKLGRITFDPVPNRE